MQNTERKKTNKILTPQKHSKDSKTAAGWRIQELLNEAIQNVFAPRGKYIPVLAIAITLGIGSATLQTLELAQLDNAIQTAADKSVGVLYPIDPQGKPAQTNRVSCEQLATNPTVTAAGALNPEGRKHFTQLGSPAPVYTASHTLLPQLKQYDALIGTQLIALPAGTVINLGQTEKPGQRPLKTLVVAEKQLAQSSSIIIGLPPAQKTESTKNCTIVLSPKIPLDEKLNTLAAQLQTETTNILLAPVTQNIPNPYTAYQARTTKYVPYALALILAALLVTTVKARSSELACYRLSGTQNAGLWLLLLLENFTVASFFTAAALAVNAFFTNAEPLLKSSAMLQDLSAGIVVATVAALLNIHQIKKSGIDLAKDR